MEETRTILTVKQPYKTSDGTTLYMGTSTTVKVDENGKYIPNSAVVSLRLYDTTLSILGTDFKTVAIRNAGEPWKLTQDGNGNYVAGLDLQRTLANRNSLMNINLNNHVSNVLQAPLQGIPAGKVNNNTASSSNAALGLPQPEVDTAVDTGSENGASSTSSTITQEALTDLAKGIPGIPPRDQYGDLRYPRDLTPTSDSIQFTMISYGTKTFKTDTFGLGERDFNKIKINGTVTMSIQPSISDLNYVRWSPSEMGPIATAAADSSLTFIEEGAAGLEAIKDKIAGTLGAEGPAIAKAIIASAAGEASGAKGLLTRVTGAMFNNNLELLFQGPELRQFTFTFKLSPRYKGEADDVKKIIRFFKQGSAVQRTTSNLFLKSPNVFRIKYLNGNKDHKSLNRIKECALVSCGVDYTPTGSYMTFTDEDASMVSYTLSLTFNELEPIYEDEYQILDDRTNDKAGIGY
jgi:hypothetical protein